MQRGAVAADAVEVSKAPKVSPNLAKTSSDTPPTEKVPSGLRSLARSVAAGVALTAGLGVLMGGTVGKALLGALALEVGLLAVGAAGAVALFALVQRNLNK